MKIKIVGSAMFKRLYLSWVHQEQFDMDGRWKIQSMERSQLIAKNKY